MLLLAVLTFSRCSHDSLSIKDSIRPVSNPSQNNSNAIIAAIGAGNIAGVNWADGRE